MRALDTPTYDLVVKEEELMKVFPTVDPRSMSTFSVTHYSWVESGSVSYACRNKQLAFVLTKKDKASKLSSSTRERDQARKK